MALAEIIAAAREFGIFQFYLPFILMFSLIYGLLQKAKIFGDIKEAKNIHLIIALSSSLFVMIFTPVGITLTQFFSNLFGQSLVVFLSILIFMLTLYLISTPLGIEFKGGKRLGIVVVLISLSLALGVYISSGGTAIFPGVILDQVPGIVIPLPGIPMLTLQDIGILVVVLATGLIIYWFMREKS